MFRIGEFSKMGMTTIKTLHYYDEIGLLKPEETDRFTNYRLYSTNQLIKLHKIQALRQIGLSIEEILLVLSGHCEKEILEKRKQEIIGDISHMEQQLSRIEFILSDREERCFMNYQAIIKDLPECMVYSKKMTVPSYDAYFEILPALGRQVMEKYPDLKCVTPEYCFIKYLDGEYKEKDINVEYNEAIDKIKPDFDGIEFKKLESVSAVSVMHKGPYADFPKAYAFAYKWIEENGYIASDSPRESYIDGIWNKEDPNEWLTELQVPVVKK